MRNVQWFRGGLVCKAHRLRVSLNSRFESNKEEEKKVEGLRVKSLGTGVHGAGFGIQGSWFGVCQCSLPPPGIEVLGEGFGLGVRALANPSRSTIQPRKKLLPIGISCEISHANTYNL